MYPEVVCGALIVSSEGKVLLMKSHKWKDMYVVPGGHIEAGEKIEDAIKREVKEETNLDVFDIEFIIHQEYVFGETYHKKKHFIFLNYACKTENTDIKLNNEAQEFVWVTPNEALIMNVEPYSKNLIQKYMKKHNL